MISTAYLLIFGTITIFLAIPIELNTLLEANLKNAHDFNTYKSSKCILMFYSLRAYHCKMVLSLHKRILCIEENWTNCI